MTSIHHFLAKLCVSSTCSRSVSKIWVDLSDIFSKWIHSSWKVRKIVDSILNHLQVCPEIAYFLRMRILWFRQITRSAFESNYFPIVTRAVALCGQHGFSDVLIHIPNVPGLLFLWAMNAILERFSFPQRLGETPPDFSTVPSRLYRRRSQWSHLISNFKSREWCGL